MGYYRKKVMTFFINNACNMRCIYCTLHSTPVNEINPDAVIDIEFAKCAIDDYFTNGFFKQDEPKGIRIFGNGEPTLQFGIVKQIVDYARLKSDGKLFVEMQSNGYFPEEYANWLRDNVNLLWISLDGKVDIQTKQRPTQDGNISFDVIDRNISILTESGKCRVGLRPTTTVYNLYRQKEIIDYALEKKVAAVYTDPWAYYLGKIEGKPKLKLFADTFLETWRYARDRGLTYGNVFTVNFDEEVAIYCRSCMPAPQLTPDGIVTCCDMVNSKEGFLPKLFPYLVFGWWDPEKKKITYKNEHIEKIKTRNINNLPDCMKCEAKKHCAGGCIGSGMVYSGDFYGVNKEYCMVTRYLFKRMQEVVNIGFDPSIPIHP